MNEPKHSALPWTEFGHTVVCKNADGNTTPVLQIEAMEDPHLAYWNMDFVIRACNAHDALLAAAKIMLEELDNYCRNSDMILAIRAIIEKADSKDSVLYNKAEAENIRASYLKILGVIAPR